MNTTKKDAPETSAKSAATGKKQTTTTQKTTMSPQQTAKNQKGKLNKSDVDVVNDGAGSTPAAKDPAVTIVKPMKK